jgi:transcriptional regulator with XRE-family HTH domain
MSLRENIKKCRLEKNLTLEDVARYIGVGKQTIQKYESGVISNIPSDKIESMAECFRTTPAALMGWEDTTDNEFVLGSIMKHVKEIDGDQMEELLRRFKKLSDEDRKLALQLIGKMNGGK